MALLSRKGRNPVLLPESARSGRGTIVLMRADPVGGNGGAGLDSLSAQGEPQLGGDITLSEGAGITLTQVGNDIEISI